MIMKKIALLMLMLSVTIFANAQFHGGFYHADPDAWVDKEPYFACKNNYTYNGWGQNIQNVTAVINASDVYSFPSVWEYDKFIIIGQESGVNFSSGDVITLYCGNQCIGSWTYKPSSAFSGIKPSPGKGTSKIIKRIWKYIRRIR